MGERVNFLSLDEILEILNKYGHLKKIGCNQWIAQCPAHSDTNPSLSIKIGRNEKVLLYCHSGCAFEQIIKALKTLKNEE